MAKANKGNLPVQFDEELAKRAAAFQSAAVAAATGGNLIQTRGGIFTYKGAPIQGNTFDAIVLSLAYENAWYPNGFDPDTPESPACFALAIADSPTAKRDMVLDLEAENPQGKDKTGACTGCWANQFNSGTRDGKPSKGKACAERRRVALLPYNDQFDAEAAASLEFAFLRFPVMSVGSIDLFAKNAFDLYKTATYGVIGNFSIVPDPKSQFKILATIKGTIKDRHILAALHARASEADQAIMFKYPKNSEREEQAKTRVAARAVRPSQKQPARPNPSKPAARPVKGAAGKGARPAASAAFGGAASKGATRPLKF